MPLYEVQCQDCNARSSILVRSTAGPFAAECPACGSRNLVRVISRFAYHKSMSTVWEESGEPGASPDSGYYEDPRNIGRWAERKLGELGMEVPPQIKEKIKAAREGELPDALEK